MLTPKLLFSPTVQCPFLECYKTFYLFLPKQISFHTFYYYYKCIEEELFNEDNKNYERHVWYQDWNQSMILWSWFWPVNDPFANCKSNPSGHITRLHLGLATNTFWLDTHINPNSLGLLNVTWVLVPAPSRLTPNTVKKQFFWFSES